MPHMYKDIHSNKGVVLPALGQYVTTMGSQSLVMDSHYLQNNYYTETPQISP
jgi:hypothetical protein